jgi:hypothetical protein
MRRLIVRSDHTRPHRIKRLRISFAESPSRQAASNSCLAIEFMRTRPLESDIATPQLRGVAMLDGI